MKRKRFSTEQIVRLPNEAQLGITVKDLCSKYGISEQTFCNWRNKYGDMDINDARKLKALEIENRQLKRLSSFLSEGKFTLYCFCLMTSHMGLCCH